MIQTKTYVPAWARVRKKDGLPFLETRELSTSSPDKLVLAVDEVRIDKRHKFMQGTTIVGTHTEASVGRIRGTRVEDDEGSRLLISRISFMGIGRPDRIRYEMSAVRSLVGLCVEEGRVLQPEGGAVAIVDRVRDEARHCGYTALLGQVETAMQLSEQTTATILQFPRPTSTD